MAITREITVSGSAKTPQECPIPTGIDIISSFLLNKNSQNSPESSLEYSKVFSFSRSSNSIGNTNSSDSSLSVWLSSPWSTTSLSWRKIVRGGSFSFYHTYLLSFLYLFWSGRGDSPLGIESRPFHHANFVMEQVTGIEPVSRPWEGRVLPLNHTCTKFGKEAFYH